MTAVAPAWKRWTLFATLFAIGTAYLASFGYFLIHSEDFVARQYNVAAREHALANSLTDDSSLQFGTGARGLRYLGSGWHQSESDGTWSNLQHAWLFIATPASRRGARLIIHADVHLPRSRGHMTVTLFGNGVQLKTWKADRRNPQLAGVVEIPGAVLASQPVALQFHLGAPTSPWRERTGNDLRTLGIRLRSIDIELSPDP